MWNPRARMSVGLVYVSGPVWWLRDLVVSAEIRTCRNQVAGRSHLPHAEIMTSPNTVLLKRGTERRDMQLSQVTTGNLRRVFQVSSGLVIKIALRHGFFVSVVHVQG